MTDDFDPKKHAEFALEEMKEHMMKIIRKAANPIVNDPRVVAARDKVLQDHVIYGTPLVFDEAMRVFDEVLSEHVGTKT